VNDTLCPKCHCSGHNQDPSFAYRWCCPQCGWKWNEDETANGIPDPLEILRGDYPQ